MKPENPVSLMYLAKGAVIEKADKAIVEVLKDIRDPNKVQETTRRVTITVDFIPAKGTRAKANIAISVVPKLAKYHPVDSMVVMGTKKDGELIAEENYQMTIEDLDLDESDKSDKTNVTDIREGAAQ